MARLPTSSGTRWSKAGTVRSTRTETSRMTFWIFLSSSARGRCRRSHDDVRSSRSTGRRGCRITGTMSGAKTSEPDLAGVLAFLRVLDSDAERGSQFLHAGRRCGGRTLRLESRLDRHSATDPDGCDGAPRLELRPAQLLVRRGRDH